MNISSKIFNISIINNVIIHEKTTSTNTLAKDYIIKGCVDGTLILAKEQTAGRGRMERSFSSPSGDGIYMSLVIKPDISPELVSQITLPIALSIVDAIGEIYNIPAKIKWPNDVLINSKKVSGILTEYKNGHVIIGVGINVNNKKLPDELTSTATSLYLESGISLELYTLIESIFKYFDGYYKSFLSDNNLSSIQEAYNNCLISYGKEVYIIPHSRTVDSVNPMLISTEDLSPYLCKGISSTGDLICIDSEGTAHSINSGEVSIRGLHGYAQ